MDNKTMLEGILWDLKVMGELTLHGTIESSTPEVNKVFQNSLIDILNLQNDLYTLMSEEKMYEISTVSETKIAKTKNKFNAELEKE